MSLRLRVAVATAGATLVVVALAGAALVALVAQSQRDDLDEDLEAQARIAGTRAAALASTDRERGTVDIPVEVGWPNLDMAARILIDGEIVILLGDDPLDGAAPATPGFSTRRLDGERWRVLSRDLADVLPNASEDALRRRAGGVVTVEVATSMDEVEQTDRAVIRQVTRLGAASLLLATGLGWAFGGTALRPLARLRRDAERVSGTDDLDVRVADEQGLREVDDLGRSLNHMLDRIRRATHETEVALDASRAFAGNAAHELRTPLTSMQANLDVLERNPALGRDERAAIVADVQAQQQRLLRLLGALRLLARGDLEEAPLDQPVDVADVVDAAVRRMRRLHPAATIAVTFDGGPFVIPAWEEGLQVLVDNLLDNAAIHGRAGPTEAAHVEVAVTAAALELRIIVDDHGPGIPPAERAHVRQRFGRGRSTDATGSGLGLALVEQQAALHGGRVEIGDSPTGGARLVVVLPVPAGWRAQG